MRGCLYPSVIFLILIKIFSVSCQEKGSLTFVIDNTGSMGDDIRQVKLGADAITKIVFEEKASQIKNMVLVTFNDPHAKLEVETESRDNLKRHINGIYVHNRYGNWDCAEPSMKGILLGLEKSLPGSFMYVFTDASSKDFWKSHDVTNTCQKKQIQITFVLTGHCYGRGEKGFKVYHDIATACSGLVFDVNKDEVNNVLGTIKETINGNKTVLKSVTVPAGKYTNIPFVIDDHTEYAIVTVSGVLVSLIISGPSAKQERMMWIDNGKVIKLSDPTPGQYIARVRGQTETSVYIVGRTDFLFSHGFSVLEPKAISDTTPQPIAKAETHLSIAVTDPKHTVTIISAQILDMNENVLKTLSLKPVAKDFYTTVPFVAPSDRFKVAVNGKAVGNGKDIRRIAKIPVTPQEPPKPKSKKPVVIIKEGPIVNVEYGATVRLTCKISAYPEPTVKWQNSRKDTLPSQSAVVEPPYEYLSYVKIADASKSDTYSCYAENKEGAASNNIEMVVSEPFNIKSTVQGTTELKYGSKGTLRCDITSSVPIHIYWTYDDEKTEISEQIVTSNKYEISADGKQLTIKNMALDVVGKYTCKASLDKDPSKFVIFSTQVKITGLIPPKITGVSAVTSNKGTNAIIECKVTDGVPKPTISWKFMPQNKTIFVSRSGSDNVLRISNVGEKYAGHYKCVAHNDAGDAEHITTLTVHVPPKILSSSSVNYTSVEDIDTQMWIPCVVTGLPKPTIIWKVNGVVISRNKKYSIEDEALIIKNPKVSDSQTYTCEATNAAGSVKANFQTNVLQIPKISEDTTKITIIQGHAVNIQCKVVKGVPKPTITWQFMAEAASKFVSLPGSDNVFHISSVDVTHSGRYKCVAHNDVGNAEHNTTLTVFVPPKVTGVPAITSIKGSNVVIECKITGGLPKPTISWQFMAKDKTRFVSRPGSENVLRISNVDVKSAGRYKCVAHNDAGDAEHDTVLTVHVPPKILSSSSVYYTSVEDTDAQMRIPCVVTGLPKPTITWKVNGVTISRNVKYSIEHDALIVKQPKVSDSQTYTCEATNAAGSVKANFQTNVLQIPKISEDTTKITAVHGDAVNIQCKVVKGVPKPTIIWQFMAEADSKFVSLPGLDNVFHISSVDVSHSGRYKCVAHNDVGNAEHNTTLTVFVPPKVIGVPAITSIKGSNVVIECKITGGLPKPTISWQFMAKDKTRFMSRPGSDNVLRISNVDVKSAGRYKCVAHNDAGDAEHDTVLTVHVPPKILSSSSVNLTSVEDTDAQMRIPCVVTGLPKPTITWKVNGATISRNIKYSIEDDALIIKNLKVSDSQTYTCEATNAAGSVKANFQTNVLQIPKISEDASKITAIQGHTVNIQCKVVKGVPKPTITWQFMAEADSKFVSLPGSDNVFHISSVDVTHSGRYKCVAHNDVGNAEHNTTLIVFVPPKVTGVPAITSIKGSNVVIECKITGGLPKPTISWQFMAKDKTRFVSRPGSDNVLRISNVDVKSAGRYKCVAHNDAGDAKHDTVLTVHVPPKILSSLSVNYTSVENRDAQMRIPCVVTGLPRPTITWKVNGATISRNVKYSIEDDALIIKNPKVSDSQTYTCEATNAAGSVKANFQTNVLQIPKISEDTTKITAIQGHTVNIQCKVVKGVPKPTITWQFMAETDSKFVSLPGSDNVFHISSVDVSHSGRYKCVAHNDVGNAEHNTTLIVFVPPKVTGVPAITSIKGSNVVIECKITGGLPKPTISWQFMAKDKTRFVSRPGSDNVLRISNVDVKSAGRYKCVAHNDAGDAEHDTVLTVHVPPKIWSSSSVNLTSVEDTDAQMRIPCVVTGLPKPTITWKVNGATITPNVKYSIEDDALIVKQPKVSDSQTYTCEATNAAGSVNANFQTNVLQIPKISEDTTKITAIHGHEVNIQCKVVKGVPKPTITWQFMAEADSKFVFLPKSDNVFHISSVDVTHSGRYKCVAHNDVGNAEHNTTLTVFVPPKVTGVPAITSIKGSNVVIECKITGGLPKPTISWQFMAKDKTRFVSRPESKNVLRISNVDVKSAGRYKCVAHNDAGDAEHDTVLTVHVPPKILSSSSVNLTSVEDTDAQMRIPCVVTGLPKPTITWKVNGATITPNVKYSIEDEALIIKNPKVSDSQTYTCEATNAAGSVKANFQTNVLQIPKISEDTTKITTIQGHAVNIQCKVVKGVPKPTITWQFMAEADSKFVSLPGSDNVFHISSVDMTHSGRYKCVAHNDVGNAEHNTTLIVFVPPKVTGVPAIASIKGSNVVIECKITGGLPKPTISWQFMAKDKTRFVSRPGSDNVLRISNVDVKSAGRYKCVAHNDAGDAEHDTVLTVHVPPKILSSSSGNLTSVEDTDAQMRIPCVVTGLPKPTITWKVNGATISRNVKYSIEDEALIIKQPKVSDSQTYTCEATNAAGSVKANFQTNVLQIPKISEDTTKITAVHGDAVNIQCKVVKGVPKPTITWQFMAEADSKFVSLPGSDNVFHISSVDVTHSGRYKCVAHNDVGNAEHNTTLIVFEAPKISVVREITARTGASVQIKCKVIKGVPTPTIAWQFMGKHDTNFAPMPATGRVLHLSEVNKKNTGRYKCIAHNVVDTAEDITTLTVKYTPIIYKTNLTYKGLEGDKALRIPCDAVGEPKATITWKVDGVVIVPNAYYSIVDGALIIKNPKKGDSKSYVCVAKNSEGITEVAFGVKIEEALDDYGTIKEINVLKGTSKKLQCGSNDPEQSVRWFIEGNDMKINQNYFYLENVDVSNDGNYTCRVSDMKGAYTFTYKVIVGYVPVFSFEQEDPVFEWNGSDNPNDMLDCSSESKPTADIVWTYNGKVLEDVHSSYLSVDGNWGHYTCNVSNVHGAIQKNFEVVSSHCLIKRKPNNSLTMPLMLTQEVTWPVLDSTIDYLQLAPGQTVMLSCPAHKGAMNTIHGFTSVNEINASCDKQDIFVVNGERYKISDLHCTHEIDPTVVGNYGKCLTETSDLMRVGYDVHGFLETYAVCFDTSKNIPLYTRVLMSKSNRGQEVTHSWYKYPGISPGKFDREYTCVNSTSSCCYTKRQLVNACDVSDGPAQRSTYIDALNSIPYYRPCDTSEDPWSNIENMVRTQFSAYSQFVAWSGIHTLQQKNGLTIPRYLWKVLRFDEVDSIAVVYINDPSPSEKDILCPNICVDDNVPWMRDLDKRTYCCNFDEFLKAFGLRDTPIGESMGGALGRIMSKKY